MSDEVRGQKGAGEGGGVALEAGRELDELIAVRVMGWEARDEYYRSDGEYAGRLIYDHISPPDGCRGGPGEGWSPSTRIKQAWEVVERMSALGWVVEMVVDCFPGGEPAGREARAYTGYGHMMRESAAAADTMPLAICRVALAALATPTSSAGPPPGTPE